MGVFASHLCLAALSAASFWSGAGSTQAITSAVIWGGLASAALLLGLLWWTSERPLASPDLP